MKRGRHRTATTISRLALVFVGFALHPIIVHSQALPGQPPPPEQPPAPGVELKIKSESARPGAIMQVKVFVTEAKPITTGFADFDFGGLFDDFAGVALTTSADDAVGVAVVRGSSVSVSFLSPSATLGLDTDRPILTVSGHIPDAAPVGTVFPIRFDVASLQLFDPTGQAYPVGVSDGSITVDDAVPAVEDVIPGSANLPAGGVVTILGAGFESTTKAKLNGIPSQTTFISPSVLQLALDVPARLHGVRLRVIKDSGARTTYYSYQRTKQQGSSILPTLSDAVPLFAGRSVTEALVDVVSVPTGLALQNREKSPVKVVLELLDPTGTILTSRKLTIAPNRFVVREISELLSALYATPSVVHITADSPIEVMGIAVDPSGTLTPVAARLPLP